MQSSQDLNNSAVITTQESADIDSIAHQSCSRKRSHSEMTDDIDGKEMKFKKVIQMNTQFDKFPKFILLQKMK